MTHHLKQAIDNKTANIGIIGLGYVGLPLISAFINAGFKTMGFDVDQTKVDSLLAGKSYIKHIASEDIAGWIEKDQLEPTSDMSRMSEADVLLICVPTPLKEHREPDISYVTNTMDSLLSHLVEGQIVPTIVQPEGKPRMAHDSWRNGARPTPEEQFE